MTDLLLDKFREECAVFGVFGHNEASTLIAEAPVEGRHRWRGSRRSRLLLGIAAFVAVLAIAFLVNWSFLRSAPVALELEIKSLAVLPLKSLVRGTDDALELGMADTIITKTASK